MELTEIACTNCTNSFDATEIFEANSANMIKVFTLKANYPLALTCSACSTTFILELDATDTGIVQQACKAHTKTILSAGRDINAGGDIVGRDKTTVTVINGAYASGAGATAVAARGVNYGSNDKIPANIITGDDCYNG